MTSVPQRIGDIVGLIGEPTRYIVRELLPDGRHAICERTITAGRRSPYLINLWLSRTWRGTSVEALAAHHGRGGYCVERSDHKT
jgi:hypothetical protein